MTKRICNVCGKGFDFWDEQENFSLYRSVGYGSAFDGENIELDMCCRCFDEMMHTYLLPKCLISPIEAN